jgi:hypothetical protein
MQAKLIATFDHLSEVDFLAKAGAITVSILDPPHFPEPWVT